MEKQDITKQDIENALKFIQDRINSENIDFSIKVKDRTVDPIHVGGFNNTSVSAVINAILNSYNLEELSKIDGNFGDSIKKRKELSNNIQYAKAVEADKNNKSQNKVANTAAAEKALAWHDLEMSAKGILANNTFINKILANNPEPTIKEIRYLIDRIEEFNNNSDNSISVNNEKISAQEQTVPIPAPETVIEDTYATTRGEEVEKTPVSEEVPTPTEEEIQAVQERFSQNNFSDEAAKHYLGKTPEEQEEIGAILNSHSTFTVFAADEYSGYGDEERAKIDTILGENPEFTLTKANKFLEKQYISMLFSPKPKDLAMASLLKTIISAQILEDFQTPIKEISAEFKRTEPEAILSSEDNNKETSLVLYKGSVSNSTLSRTTILSRTRNKKPIETNFLKEIPKYEDVIIIPPYEEESTNVGDNKIVPFELPKGEELESKEEIYGESLTFTDEGTPIEQELSENITKFKLNKEDSVAIKDSLEQEKEEVINKGKSFNTNSIIFTDETIDSLEEKKIRDAKFTNQYPLISIEKVQEMDDTNSIYRAKLITDKEKIDKPKEIHFLQEELDEKSKKVTLIYEKEEDKDLESFAIIMVNLAKENKKQINLTNTKEEMKTEIIKIAKENNVPIIDNSNKRATTWTQYNSKNPGIGSKLKVS